MSVERLPGGLAGARRGWIATPTQIILQVKVQPFQQQYAVAEEIQEHAGTEAGFQVGAVLKGAAAASRIAAKRGLQDGVAGFGSGPELALTPATPQAAVVGQLQLFEDS